MKAFIASLAVFLAVAAAVTASAVFADREAGALLDMIDKLPDTANKLSEALGGIEKEWNGVKRTFSLFVSRLETERIDAAIASVRAAAEADDQGGCAVAKSALRDSVLSLKRVTGIPFLSEWILSRFN